MFKSKSIQAFLIFFLLIEVPIAYTQARDYWPTVNWRSSLPEMQGVDSEELGVMTKYVKEKLPQTSSILIVRNGYLIYEQYFAGKSDDLCSVWSISKSVISTLLGMAKDSGSISGLDQRLIDFFPQFKSDSAQAAVNRVTLRHMLTMSSGLSNENGVPDPELIKRIVDYSMNKNLAASSSIMKTTRPWFL
jgi:CubicO group peptidase (beta-lactamase class C family)